MSCNKTTFRKGQTAELVYRWLTANFVYKPITGISSAAPVVIECVGHGIVESELVCITGVKGGGSQLNGNPEKYRTWFQADRVDDDHVSINSVNGAAWAAYVSGGILQYHEPQDLTGCTAFGQLREAIDSPVALMEFTTADGSIEIAGHKVTVNFDPVETDALEVSEGYFDYRIVYPDNDVKYSLTMHLIFEDGVTQ